MHNSKLFFFLDYAQMFSYVYSTDSHTYIGSKYTYIIYFPLQFAEQRKPSTVIIGLYSIFISVSYLHNVNLHCTTVAT